MRDILATCIQKHSDRALVKFLRDYSRVPAVSTMYGTAFENFALRRLMVGGKFPIKRLKDKDATVLDTSSRKTPLGLSRGFLRFPRSAIQRHPCLATLADAVLAATRLRCNGDKSSITSRAALFVPLSKSFCCVDAIVPAPIGTEPYSFFLANATTDVTHSIKISDHRSTGGSTEYSGGLGAIMDKLYSSADGDSDVCMLWLVPPRVYAAMSFASPFRMDVPMKKREDRISAMADYPVCKRVVQYALCVDL